MVRRRRCHSLTIFQIIIGESELRKRKRMNVLLVLVRLSLQPLTKQNPFPVHFILNRRI